MNAQNESPTSRLVRGFALGPWTEVCGNPHCRTGWLQLWRSRSAPRLEGAWACSAGCMEAIAALVVKRCVADWEEGTAGRELLMPLGLVLLSRGWISRDELNSSLAAQRRYEKGKIGEWLRRLSGVSEATIAKGLAAQWNCTALTQAGSTLEPADHLVPPALLRQYDLVLIRHASSARLYLAGRSRAEYAAAQALQSMLQVPVETAFLEETAWLRHSQALANSGFADPGFAEPHPEGQAVQITQSIERRRPQSARVVRIHNQLWLRMWGARRMRSQGPVEDVVIPLRAQTGIVKTG